MKRPVGRPERRPVGLVAAETGVYRGRTSWSGPCFPLSPRPRNGACGRGGRRPEKNSWEDDDQLATGAGAGGDGSLSDQLGRGRGPNRRPVGWGSRGDGRRRGPVGARGGKGGVDNQLVKVGPVGGHRPVGLELAPTVRGKGRGGSSEGRPVGQGLCPGDQLALSGLGLGLGRPAPPTAVLCATSWSRGWGTAAGVGDSGGRTPPEPPKRTTSWPGLEGGTGTAAGRPRPWGPGQTEGGSPAGGEDQLVRHGRPPQRPRRGPSLAL